MRIEASLVASVVALAACSSGTQGSKSTGGTSTGASRGSTSAGASTSGGASTGGEASTGGTTAASSGGTGVTSTGAGTGTTGGSGSGSSGGTSTGSSATTGGTGSGSASGGSSGGADAGFAEGSLTGAGAFQPLFVGSNLAQGVDDKSFVYGAALYVTFFDSDLSASWPAICSSVSATTVPGSGSYVQLELLTPTGPFSTGVFPVGAQYEGLPNDFAKVSGGTAALPGTLTGASGQVTLTQIGGDGSASGSFSVALSGGSGTLSGTFTVTPGCAATAPDGGSSASAGCSASSGAGTYLACTSGAGCLCPNGCTDDPYLSPTVGSSVCEQPCLSSADCTDLTTFCQNGFCHLSPCGPSQGNADGACQTGDGQAGSCIDYNYDGTNSLAAIWACALAGTATGACDPINGPARPSYSARCIGGETCDTDNGYDQCVPLCNPAAAGACTNGYSCIASSAFGQTGFCGP